MTDSQITKKVSTNLEMVLNRSTFAQSSRFMATTIFVTYPLLKISYYCSYFYSLS